MTLTALISWNCSPRPLVRNSAGQPSFGERRAIRRLKKGTGWTEVNEGKQGKRAGGTQKWKFENAGDLPVFRRPKEAIEDQTRARAWRKVREEPATGRRRPYGFCSWTDGIEKEQKEEAYDHSYAWLLSFDDLHPWIWRNGITGLLCWRLGPGGRVFPNHHPGLYRGKSG